MTKTPQGFYQFQFFKKFPEVINLITTKKFGNLRHAKNLEKILKKIDSGFNFVRFGQVHGSKITIVNNKNLGFCKRFDGGVTNLKKLILPVFVADCHPILAYDPNKKIIGIAHAGWRGVKAQIGKNLVFKMKSLGANANNIVIGLGPGICVNHYEVKDDVAGKFDEKFQVEKNSKRFLDLQKAIISQLLKAGIKKENIETAGVCVFEDENFFSARRDKTEERFTALIGIKE